MGFSLVHVAPEHHSDSALDRLIDGWIGRQIDG